MDGNEFDQRLAAGRSRLLKRVTSRERARRTVMATAVLLIAGTGAAALLGAQSADGQAAAASVTCYSKADLSAPHKATISLSSNVTATTHLTSNDGTRLCETFWTESGVVSTSGAKRDVVTVVEAALCRLADGTVGVFPNDRTATTDRQLCDDLGLTVVA